MWAASCLASCCAACACDACRTVVSGISRRSARIAYCGLFALSLIVSWILREVAAPLMEKIPCKYFFLLLFPVMYEENINRYMYFFLLQYALYVEKAYDLICIVRLWGLCVLKKIL